MVRSTSKDALTEIERAIEAEVRNRPPVYEPNAAAQPRVSAPAMAMPDYVEHSAGATEIGKLSAEAVVREYEIAAKEIEAMSAELIDLVKQCEGVTRGATTVTEEVEGDCRPLPRGGKARVPADRELLAGDRGSPKSLHRAKRQDRHPKLSDEIRESVNYTGRI